ncbi:MAG TPA: methyltransferase [Bryobacteraceae bacterium]|nr:methyltransferase [Bryobacteraceae bacterium]
MSTDNATQILAVGCFVSFGWGMVRHFRRIGKPAAWTRVTASLAIPCALANLASLFWREIRFPLGASMLYLASLSLFWSSVSVSKGALAACGQSHVSPCLVTRGPYRIMRHPFYLSYDLAWIGGFVATAWWPLAVIAIAMAALYERFVREEERGFLCGVLAAEYAAYKRLTGKYFPKSILD